MRKTLEKAGGVVNPNRTCSAPKKLRKQLTKGIVNPYIHNSGGTLVHEQGKKKKNGKGGLLNHFHNTVTVMWGEVRATL